MQMHKMGLLIRSYKQRNSNGFEEFALLTIEIEGFVTREGGILGD